MKTTYGSLGNHWTRKGYQMPKERIPFHVRLRALRESRNLSYRKMSVELQERYGIEVSATAIQKWESTKEKGRLPTRDKISAICQMFNVSPSFLLDELFSNAESVKPNDRLAQFSDIEMLTDDDFAALLQIKNSLIARRQLKITI
jgi:transcriptional regulator with XRE-family HTH domain